MFSVQAVFLLTATPWLMASTHIFFAETPAESTLIADVGQNRVGFAQCPSILSMPQLGILPEGNVGYGVSEAAAYDGTVPKSYFTAYYSLIHQPLPKFLGFGQYCPSMTTATVARHFGVSFILGHAGTPGPSGTTLTASISNQGGDESLYAVPGSGLITYEPDGMAEDSADATVAPWSESDPAVVHTTVQASRPSTVYIHITDAPGWTATVNGAPLTLKSWGGTLMSAEVPAGRSVIVLTYSPRAFQVGLILALVTLVVLLAVVGLHWLVLRAPDRPWPPIGRRRLRRAPPRPAGSSAD